MAWIRRFRKIKVYFNFLNAVTVTLLNDGRPPTHSYRTMVEDTHQIHNRESNVK
jgi:hypothetical protein